MAPTTALRILPLAALLSPKAVLAIPAMVPLPEVLEDLEDPGHLIARLLIVRLLYDENRGGSNL